MKEVRSNRDLLLEWGNSAVHENLSHGFLHDRVQWCHRELGFVNQWEADSKYLEQIIGREATPEDYWTAASLFQWLGTNIGMGSLERALKYSGHWIEGDYYPKPIPDRTNSEPLLKSMAETLAEVEWEARRCKASNHAAQMLFDLSEPN